MLGEQLLDKFAERLVEGFLSAAGVGEEQPAVFQIEAKVFQLLVEIG